MSDHSEYREVGKTDSGHDMVLRTSDDRKFVMVPLIEWDQLVPPDTDKPAWPLTLQQETAWLQDGIERRQKRLEELERAERG